MDLVSTTETPRKRKHSEYHDPDYQQHHDTQLGAGKFPEQKRIKVLEKKEQTETPVAPDAIEANPELRATQLQRICELIRTEFQRELSQKEQQLAEIDGRLLQARQLLDKLRYQVVSEYYRKQQVTLNAADVVKVRGKDSLFGDEGSSGPQMPLHPAIKKIVGKRPLQPQPSQPPERNAAVVAKQSIKLRNPAHRRAERRRQQKIKQQGIVTDHSREEGQSTKLETDPDEEPCTSRQAYERQQQQQQHQLELNASRLNNKNKFVFVVGNTSKYIGQESLAYKWLVYLQGKSLPQPLEAYIRKVRFHLHHTYRPNDIVDVHKPPFQLSRRGWGEFPMRIQLYFQEKLQQKPIQLMHTIVLDKTKCGLHTMGAETILEVWLKAEALPTQPEACPPPVPAAPPAHPASLDINPLFDDSSKPRTISITQNKEELDDNLFAGDISDIDNIEELQPTVLVTETLKLSSPKKTKTPNHPSPSIVYLPVNGSPKKPNHLQILGNGQTKKKNVVFQKAGKLYIIDPQQSKLKQAVKQQSLLKPQLSLLKPTARRWHLMLCIQHDHGYANMSANAEEATHQPSPTMVNNHLSASLTPHQRLEQLFAGLQFQSMRYAIEFLLRRLPLVCDQYSDHYPFMVATTKAFKEQSALRQRCFEYLRARSMLQCLKQHLKLQQINASGREIYWSIREIVSFARLHGYTPPLKTMTKGNWEAAPSSDSHRQLSQRVQEQLNEKPSSHCLSFCSLSSNRCVETWISKQLPHVTFCRREDQELIDVEAITNEMATNSVHVQKVPPPQKYQTNHNQSHFLHLPPPTHLETAAELVTEMCKNINIHLDTEQPVPGVSQSLSLILLSHVLRMFVEKLVRQSVATKLQQQHQHMDTILLPQAAANSDMLLQPQDIARVIVQCSELDFLGNGHLGVLASMEPQT
ncbi:uncharacterized protein Dwil_GK18381 [Drosophila willistoni]|uniref:YEATS domain-containing protein n=1 Tax=Drosophila willistoni TaxID=7260 RepID=B4NLK5_DROWI|nr:uncharacterized protein Dwil_GK18381 [Drosophila willistoni]